LKIIVYEYVSGGGFAEKAIPPGLLAEGYAMLRSITTDFKAAGHEVTILLDARISKFRLPIDADCILPIFFADEPQKVILCKSNQIDAIFIIAPESGQTLEHLIKSVERTGKILLNCTAEGIAAVSDKAKLTSYLQSNRYNTPKTIILDLSDDLTQLEEKIACQLPFPIVLKPLDGTGCSGIIKVKNSNESHEALQKIKKQNLHLKFIAQEYINGLPASVSLISNGQRAVGITLNMQQITLAGPEGQSSYDGGCVPLEHHLKEKAITIAEQIVSSTPGLYGYVGVDLILTEQDIYVVDINPRLTTSYVGLHAICTINIAQAIVDSITLSKLPDKCVNRSVVFFSKSQVLPPSIDCFQKISKLSNIVTPPFLLNETEGTVAFVFGQGVSMQDAFLHLEEAKKTLCSIMG
jgi:tyramine---L-glutamate ligase